MERESEKHLKLRESIKESRCYNGSTFMVMDNNLSYNSP